MHLPGLLFQRRGTSPEAPYGRSIESVSDPLEQTIRLVTRAREGDADSFAQLYERVAPAVHTWAELRIRPSQRNVLEPTDLVQEVWLRAWRGLEGLDIEVAGEYLVIAATLMAIKSRSLLPREEIELEDALATSDRPEELLLALRGIPKRFPGVLALDGVATRKWHMVRIYWRRSRCFRCLHARCG